MLEGEAEYTMKDLAYPFSHISFLLEPSCVKVWFIR